MRKRILRVLAVVLAILILAGIGGGVWVRSQLTGSLPRLDGQLEVVGIAAPVRVERDELGIPTIHAKNRPDLAYATGFVHAQDRFFQMDLLRRNSAGELAELVGPAVIEVDRKSRVHRFRDVAGRMLAAAPDDDRVILAAYTAGVNAGLAALRKKPFEYLLLDVEPAPWRAEDSALVMFSMYLDLQGEDAEDESTLGVLHDLLPEPMFDFLAPRGTKWDAPLQGEAFAVPPTPSGEVFDLRTTPPTTSARNDHLGGGRPARLELADATRRARRPPPNIFALPDSDDLDHFKPGSNNWAVAGSHTSDRRAIVADDMHLGLRVPHVWYRASFVWGDKDDPGGQQQITGATLPGTPAMVVGSNGHIAWGFTNSEGDWVDLVIVEPEGNDKKAYRTPDGPRAFEHHSEVIKVKGGADETLEVVSTIWGPIVDHDHLNRPRALRWVAHDPQGVNMGALRLESARTLDEAMRVANESGSPAQNFVVADRTGGIAWTILGRIPRRVGFDGRLPGSWADGARKWDGWLTPEEYPRIVNPANGRIWTANARVVDGPMLATLGDGGYDLGARASQIRDDLLAVDKADEADMLDIQLDDRAVFLEPWQKLLLSLLTAEAIADDARRQEARELVENWGGHAAIDSAGFRIVRGFRQAVIKQVLTSLTQTCKRADAKFDLARQDRSEGPVWQLITERPPHLLDPRYLTWDAMLLATLDATIDGLAPNGKSLADCTWGEYNTTKIQHPLSRAVPRLSPWLDMPGEPLPGDTANMPRIQGPAVGASQRMAVSPGHEEQGYFHMPCGQSGHPLSPHYADGHSAWSHGARTPFLPGPTMHVLVLFPADTSL